MIVCQQFLFEGQAVHTRNELHAFLQSAEGRALLERWYGRGMLDRERGRWTRLADRFFETFRQDRAVFVSSPGRTELGGNHTDHNNGAVLCAAVSLDALACAAPRSDSVMELASDGWPETFVVDGAALEPLAAEYGSPAALLRGTAACMAMRGYKTGGFSACLASAVPPGSGLSSSAAVEVLFAHIQNILYNEGRIPPHELAHIAQEAENVFFGKPCGLMDQMAAAIGGIVYIDFAQPVRFKKLAFDFEAAGYNIAVINAGGSHAGLTDEYAAIPAEMKAVAALFGQAALRKISMEQLLRRSPEIRAQLGDRAFLRAIHFIQETERAGAMCAALESGKIKKYIKLVKKSGDSSWELLQNIAPQGSPREQPVAAAIALARHYAGKHGAARVHGGGFAGTIQAYIQADKTEAFADYMSVCFGAVTVLKIRPDGVSEVRF